MRRPRSVCALRSPLRRGDRQTRRNGQPKRHAGIAATLRPALPRILEHATRVASETATGRNGIIE